MKVKINGTGIYLPPRIEKAKDIAKLINKSTSWVENKSGVYERRISDIDVDEMGAIAGLEALSGGAAPDLIINASGVPKQTIPDTATFFQKQMGFEGIPSFSIHCTCLSFVVALHTASSLIISGAYERILIISSDKGSKGRNFREPESASLLGDGAAAILLEKSSKNEPSELLHHTMRTWPSGANLTEVRGGGTYKHPHDPDTKFEDNLFSMDGPAVYKIALKQVNRILQNTLKNTGLSRESIDWVVPHQASGKAVQAYSTMGKFKKNQVLESVSKFGNCVAASIPMTFVLAVKYEKIKRGDIILFIGTGAGLSAGCTLIRY